MQLPHYHHPLQMHSTPTQASEFWFVPLFLLPLATLKEMLGLLIFFFLLAFTQKHQHWSMPLLLLHFPSGVRREKVTAEHFWYTSDFAD